jgi:hypothetical protein
MVLFFPSGKSFLNSIRSLLPGNAALAASALDSLTPTFPFIFARLYAIYNADARIPPMPRNEHLTRVELIDPVLAEKGWTDDLLREEKTPGGVDVLDGKPRKRKGALTT